MNPLTRLLAWLGVEDGADVETVAAAAIGGLERQVDEARRWTARAIGAERRLARTLAELPDTLPGDTPKRAALAAQYAAVRQSSAELRQMLNQLRAALADARRRQRWLAARCAVFEARVAVRRLMHQPKDGERPEQILAGLERDFEEITKEVFGKEKSRSR
jgi:phage shock protein A